MYSVYELSQESREFLLALRPPSFPEIITHHITYQFPDSSVPPIPTSVEAIGFAKGEKIECWVIAIDGETTRPGGGIFHITASLNREAGAKPVHSNRLIASQGWITLEIPISLKVEAKLLGFARKKKRKKESPTIKSEAKGKGTQ